MAAGSITDISRDLAATQLPGSSASATSTTLPAIGVVTAEPRLLVLQGAIFGDRGLVFALGDLAARQQFRIGPAAPICHSAISISVRAWAIL